MNKELKQNTLDFIALNGFTELSAVQNEVLKISKTHKDIIALSKTGTGKTHAYLIPIMEMINTKSDKTQVVISLPTRELAYQVNQNCKLMQEVLPDLRIQLLSGGTDKSRSIAKMDKTPHIVIGTPGRIKDLFLSNALRVDFVQMFVIDEADMTLDYGFLEDIDTVFSHMVKNPQVLCFSATFPEELQKFVRKYLNNPRIVKVEDKKREKKIDYEARQIAKSLYRKNEKVKPNYKKKKKQEVERIKRKKTREYIRAKIKEEKKQRYKNASKEE